jgi:SAM-dependent methyltransferase
MSTPEEQRAAMLEGWEGSAAGWGRRATRVRDFGMPVSSWMLDHLALQPGQRVLELAAGPGDTGFLAAELIQPGGMLICSDGTEAMLEVARERARALSIDNVEFRRLELEWIDVPTADVDGVLCRWALMLIVDPAAALSECRRVLRPGGQVALAVWDEAVHNPWATIPSRALEQTGVVQGSPPAGPGMFALAEPGRLQEMLEAAGFTEVLVDRVEVSREFEGVGEYLEETLDLSRQFREVLSSLEPSKQDEVRRELDSLVEPYRQENGLVHLPGRTLVAAGSA